MVIETDAEQTYYINDTEDGFQCDEFDYYFEDLDSIAETLFRNCAKINLHFHPLTITFWV